MSVWLVTIISALVVSAISFVGIAAITLARDNRQQMIRILLSFAVGALFGDAFIHLLPEAFQRLSREMIASFSAIAGIIVFLSLETIIRWRPAHVVSNRPSSLAIMNLIGDGLHNFVDGLLIGGSYLASFPIGIATTTAVMLHEIPTEIGDAAILKRAGFSTKKILGWNFASAVLAVIGATVSLLVGSRIEMYTSLLLPFTAGAFVYIAGADIVPELHREAKLSTALIQLLGVISGVGVMALLTRIE